MPHHTYAAHQLHDFGITVNRYVDANFYMLCVFIFLILVDVDMLFYIVQTKTINYTCNAFTNKLVIWLVLCRGQQKCTMHAKQETKRVYSNMFLIFGMFHCVSAQLFWLHQPTKQYKYAKKHNKSIKWSFFFRFFVFQNVTHPSSVLMSF